MAGFDLHSVCVRCRDKKRGKDPCVEKADSDCQHCKLLTPEQLVQLSTPSYKLKKEKRETKSSTTSKDPPSSVTLSPTLVGPALVSVMGVKDGQSTLRSPGLSVQPAEKKKKTEDKKATSSKLVKPDKPVKSTSNRPSSSTDSRFDELDQKWSDRFNRLEALLMARTLDRPQEHTFSTVKVAPTHSPPANVVRTEPFLKPADQPAATDPPPSKHRSTDKSGSDLPQVSHRPATTEPTRQAVVQKPTTSALEQTSRDSFSSDSDSDSFTSDRPPVDLFVEEGELSDDQEVTITDTDQSLSEEHTYRETMRGIRSYMGWTHIPDIDSCATTSDDNPFAGPKLQTPGKVSVNPPTDEWLCRKMNKLNLTLVRGSPLVPQRQEVYSGINLYDRLSRKANGMGFTTGQKKQGPTDNISSWNTSSSRLNSTYLRIARQAGIASNPRLSRLISQESLRKWEKSAQESSVIYNQAAGFNHCLLNVQQNMQTQIKAIRTESNGKSASKVSVATEELQYLVDFNSSICQAMAKSMEHLTDFVFVNMVNLTLVRRDSYLLYLKAGIKPDTLAALRTAPLQLDTLFLDSVIKQAEEDIAAYDKSRTGSMYKKGQYQPYEREEKRSDNKKQDRPAWKNISHNQHRQGKGKHQYSSRPAKGQQSYK